MLEPFNSMWKIMKMTMIGNEDDSADGGNDKEED